MTYIVEQLPLNNLLCSNVTPRVVPSCSIVVLIPTLSRLLLQFLTAGACARLQAVGGSGGGEWYGEFG